MPIRLGNYVGRYCERLDSVTASLGDHAVAQPSRAELDVAAPRAEDEATRTMLRCFNDRLARGEPLKLVIFGTSVTAGNRCNARHGANYPQLLAQLLQRRYPQANLTLSVFSYPGASPVFMRSCLGTLLPASDADADLVVVEMTDNLAKSAAGAGTELELLLGALRARSPRAAAVLLTPIDQTCVRGLKRMKPFQHLDPGVEGTKQVLARCYANDTAAAAIESIAAAHGLARVSQRHGVRRRFEADPEHATHLIGQLVHDQAHPGRRGHLQLALGLEHAIARHARPPSEPAPPPRAAPLGAECARGAPPWREAANLFAPRAAGDGRAKEQVCALGHEIAQYVTRADGWNYAVERNKQGLPKPGYVATAPGAALELCFAPRPPPPDALERATGRGGVATLQYAWSLGYLMSYVHMGRVRGECVRGGACACGARIFDAHWKRQVSVPHVSRLMLKYRYKKRASGVWAARGGGQGACPCTIRLTVLNETSSEAHKFKLVALMSGFYTGTIVGDAVTWAANFGIM